jgi:hypothetical protein
MTEYAYRELHNLNPTVPDLNKIVDLNGVEIYALKPLGVGFIELEAPTKEGLHQLDQSCTTAIKFICKQHKIENHYVGPLEII